MLHLILSRAFICFSVILLLPFSLNVQAEGSSPELDDAKALIEVRPSQSLTIAQEYLSSRKLLSKPDAQAYNTMGKDNADTKLRTPVTTIEALLIIARSQLALKNNTEALESIKQAEELAENFDLPVKDIEIELYKARAVWEIYKNRSKVKPILDEVETDLINEKLVEPERIKFQYQSTILKAQMASSMKQVEFSDNYFEQAENYLEKIETPELKIKFALIYGAHDLQYLRFNQALYNLLTAYWSAVEADLPALLAKTNRLLAELYYQRNIYNKALDHLSQAADYYDNYGNSIVLSDVLTDMADIYYLQGRYNLALVHYFNVLDSESIQNNFEKIIELRLKLAQTYLQLYNYTLTEQYIINAESLLAFSEHKNLQALSLLIQAELLNQTNSHKEGIEKALNALKISKEINNKELQIKSHLLLSSIYNNIGEYKTAYNHLHQHNKLTTLKQNQLSEIAGNDFTQQQQFISKSIHYQSQQAQIEKSKNERARFQSAATALFALSAIILILFIRRGIKIKGMKNQLNELYNDHYTHPRSGLRNLRMLNVNLPSSLEQSSANFEQWKTGELIHEPLHDKLRLVMVDLPFLRAAYLKQGYTAGLDLEKRFGEFIKTKIEKPARLYHFSDAMFLYVTQNTSPEQTAEELFSTIERWINEFEPSENIERTIRAGIADYPFLPKAYTAINDKELIDILLIALGMARKLSLEHNESHWVNLKAIENAPAASFTDENIRTACIKAIENGLIKIHSSYKFEDSIINFELTD